MLAEERGISASDAIHVLHQERPSRRRFLASLAGGATIAAEAHGRARGRQIDVGIVGAGLAGLMCAHELRRRGVKPVTIYDASVRAGGRMWTLRDYFPGQVAERGAELIDSRHKVMRRLARSFNLRLEDLSKQPGDLTFFFGGVRVPEGAIVEEFRTIAPALKRERRALSNRPNALRHTPNDQMLDRRNLREFLESLQAPPLAFKALEQAYEAEYGLEIEEQSALNLLLFLDFRGKSHFDPYGAISDERYHVAEGNDAIIRELSGGLRGALQFGMALRRVARTAVGAIELTFEQDGRSFRKAHDAAVLAIPFAVLREVELDSGLSLPESKLRAIRELGYGTNAKMKVGFTARPWQQVGSNGASYSDLKNHQATWETNPTRASSDRAVLTDYSSGRRGARLDPTDVQQEARRFLADLNLIFPGAEDRARRRGECIAVHLEHWPSNPLARGSYTCYRPGQFTTLAGHEGTPAGNLFFAGEHTDSFFEWQGFMEGAARSGIRAAAEILKA
jgi:monoamine oxidase